MVSLYGVLSTHIDEVWEDAKVFIERAIAFADGKYSIESVYSALKEQDMQLWLGMNGKIQVAGVTQIINYPDKKVCSLMFVSGDQMNEWFHLLNGVEMWAKEQGCESIEIWGRKGWEKVLGWEQIHSVIRKNL